MNTKDLKITFASLLSLGVLLLIWFSFQLATTRIFQVDECQNIFSAHVLATGQEKTFFTSISPFLAALAAMPQGTSHSYDLFSSARLLMVGVFWLNVLLIALAASQPHFKHRGIFAILGAATLAPLWDYGFEIRHDNIIVTGVLLTWLFVRIRPLGFSSFLLAGALAVGLQFIALKAFVYTVPITMLVLAFPPPGHQASRWKLFSAWLAGALGALVFIRCAYGAAGMWDLFVTDLHRVAGDATGNNRFPPSWTLGRLLSQTPLLLAILLAATVALVWDIKERKRHAFTWESNLPEGFLFAIAFGALMINPTPFPYNLLHLVPYAFIFAFRYAADLWNEARSRPPLLPAALALVLFAHFVPFWLATRRHFEWPNYRQERLMQLAEELTNPAKDPVYDGIGMVPTRPAIHFQWFLHSFNIERFRSGAGPRVRDMLAANPAAVFIPNYRTDWLPGPDHRFIREHYVSLADDLWVLGKVLPTGGDTFEIIHSGRYRISSLPGSDIVGSYPEGFGGLMTPEVEGCITGTLDGKPLPEGPVELCAGIHRIECASDCQPAVVWMGPHVNRVHRVPAGDHTTLFVNWY